MKKMLSFGVLALFLSACNDGDIVYKEMNFESNAIQKCATKDLYYKTNAKDMMILKAEPNLLHEKNFKLGETKVVEIGSALELLYRTYDENADSKSICETLPPAKPVIVSEMTANAGGTVLITRDVRTQEKEELESPTVLSYFYRFLFENISFKDGDQTINQNNFSFGEYKYKDIALTFKFIGKVKNCNLIDATRLVVNNDTEALLLNIGNGVIENVAATKTVSLNDTNNLIYKVFDAKGGAINAEKACTDETEFGDTIEIENWKSTSGTLVIVTTEVTQGENAPSGKVEFLHKLSLENVTFTKEGRSFTRALVPYGEITTSL
ncbi:hypothetical protein [Flavobacterium sp. JP2137]|uniref:hypothetical protein n=1 Tax=Flavobacterium sp. JP2137 TaxID=3414510 RepID=UPI003D2FCF2B